MAQKIVIGVLMTLGLVLVTGFWFASNKIENLPKMNQAFFNKKIDAFIASDKTSGTTKQGIEYTIRDLEVTLKESTIETRFHINLEWKSLQAEVDATLNGYPIYRDGEFYFHPDPDVPPEFHTLKITRKADNPPGTMISRGWKKLTGSKKETKPAKKDGSIAGRIAEKVPGVKKVVDKTIEKVLADDGLIEDITIKVMTRALENFPIYRLGDSIPENAAAIAISDFKVENRILVIEISFWNLAWHLILILIIAVIVLGLAIAIFMNPRLLEGFLIFGMISG